MLSANAPERKAEWQVADSANKEQRPVSVEMEICGS